MKRILVILFFISFSTLGQKLSVYNDDYTIKTGRPLGFKADSSVNIFDYMFFYQKEVFSAGFKSTEYRLVNENLLIDIMGQEIYFSPSIIFKDTFGGFFKSSDLRTPYSLKTKEGNNQSANIFIVDDIIVDKNTNEIIALALVKKVPDGSPTIYWSPREYAKKTGAETATFEELGVFWMPYIEFLKRKYTKNKYHIAFHRGDLINVPNNTDVPLSYVLKENQKELEMNQAEILTETLYLANYNTMAFSLFLNVGLEYNYQKQVQRFKDFREKQRNLLYDYDLGSNTYLSKSSFNENEIWKCIDVKILEDSHTPVLIMENSKNQKIFVIEKLRDLLIDTKKATEYRAKFGKDKFSKLFNGVYEFGMPVELIRFAKGYENSMVSWENSATTYKSIFAYGKLHMYYENNKLVKEDWIGYREVAPKVIVDPVK